jgi:hypothetical protein
MKAPALFPSRLVCNQYWHLYGACFTALSPALHRKRPRIYYRSRLVYSTRFAVPHLTLGT